MKLSTFLTLGLIFIFVISCKNQGKEKGKYLLLSADYTSANFLKQWNKTSIEEFQHNFPNNKFIQLYIDNLQDDSLNSLGASRGKLLSTIRNRSVIPDSIRYDAIYVIETRHDGEYIFYVDYLIIDSSPIDYYYKFKSGLGLWKLVKRTEGDFSYVKKLYTNFLTQTRDSSKDAQNVGPLIITKVNPDTLITKVILRPSEEQMNSISILSKLSKATEE